MNMEKLLEERRAKKAKELGQKIGLEPLPLVNRPRPWLTEDSDDVEDEIKLDVESGAQPTAKGGAKPKVKANAQPEAERGVKAGAKGGVKSEAEGGVKARVKVGAERDAEGDVKAGAEGSVTPRVEGGVNAGIEGSVKSEVEGSVKVNVEGAVKPEVEGSVKGSAKGDVKPEVEDSVKASAEVDAKPEVKGDVKSSAEVGAKPEVKGGVKASSEGDAKPKVEGGVKDSAEVSVKPRAKADVTKARNILKTKDSLAFLSDGVSYRLFNTNHLSVLSEICKLCISKQSLSSDKVPYDFIAKKTSLMPVSVKGIVRKLVSANILVFRSDQFISGRKGRGFEVSEQALACMLANDLNLKRWIANQTLRVEEVKNIYDFK